ncbi:MAG: O-antigen ligase family protein [Candidatus Marinimicrobia bacterium]|nr:O-antigen ligase family protein [Candidatus Neomarinimicrobiota bacterium]
MYGSNRTNGGTIVGTNRRADSNLWPVLGLDAETAPSILIILAGTVLIGGALYFSHGNIFAGAAVLAVMGLLLITWYRVDLSLYVLYGMVLVFDQFHIPGFYPITYTLDFFRNLKEISFLPTISAGVMNPIEIHLVLILFVWFLVVAIKKRFALRSVPAWGPAILFFGWLLLAYAMGIQQGGDFLTALWEVRALFYLGVVYIVVPQIIQTRRQVEIFMWVTIGAITVKALQAIARFIALGFSFGGRPTLTNHEDPVFIVTLFVLAIGLVLFNSKHRQKLILLLLALPLYMGFFLGQRRAAYASFIISMGAFVFLLPRIARWKFIKAAVPVVILALIYFAAFWNSNSTLASPVQQIKSGIYGLDRDVVSDQDYYSNLYREYENYNLAYTTRRHPVMGVGFGRKYEQPLGLANINFPLRDYIPHNEIFWVIVKTGGIGFFLFWLFFNSVGAKAASLSMRIQDPYLKAIAVMIAIAIINQMTVSFYDLQLTYYRNMIYLGALMGLLPTLEHLAPEKGENNAKQ